MSFDPREFLRHILAEATYLEATSATLTRDRLIHEYFGVDLDLVWDVVQHKIPPLRAHLAAIIAAG